MCQYKKEYYRTNRDKIIQDMIDRIRSNLILRLIDNNRSRINRALQYNSKTDHTIDLLGCSKKFFYNWIKWQLPYDMNDDKLKK